MSVDTHQLRELLLQSDQEFRELALKHHELDDRLHDLGVGHVQSGGHLHRAHVTRRRRAQPLVGDQGDLDLRALSGAKQHLLDHHRAGVGVDPDARRRRRWVHVEAGQRRVPSVTVWVRPPTQMASPSMSTLKCASCPTSRPWLTR